LERLPDHERNRPEWADMRAQACTPSINIVNLIYEAKHSRRNSKDYEFGTEAMREHWAAGLSDIRNTLAKPGILARPGEGACFVAHDIHRSGVHRA
jgi:NTE family protein